MTVIWISSVLYLCVLWVCVAENEFLFHYKSALRYAAENDLNSAEKHILEALQYEPNNANANGVLGSVYTLSQQPGLATQYLKIALDNGGWSNTETVANYMESLRQSGTLLEAERIYHQAIANGINSFNVHFTAGVLYMSMERRADALNCFRKAAQSFGENANVGWAKALEHLCLLRMYPEAVELGVPALQEFPSERMVAFNLGLAYHYQSMFDEARIVYDSIIRMHPDYSPAYINLGAVYQALGDFKQASHIYGLVYETKQDEAGFLNNYGSLLLLMNVVERGVEMLQRSLQLDPYMENALINLASYYQDEGLMDEAEKLLARAVNISNHARMIEVRIATLLSPVAQSWEHMMTERDRMIKRLLELLKLPVPEKGYYQLLDSSLDRIHFYLVYHGLNDRPIQELIAAAYQLNIRNFSKIAPHLLHPSVTDVKQSEIVQPYRSTTLSTLQRRVRVGFISKYFGVFEPHGMLLDGVIRYLPRSHFEVIALPVVLTDGKILSPFIENFADRVLYIHLEHMNAVNQICDLQLDILVFADTLSEPMTHFLAHSRLASVQVTFWGNPITSGSQHMDYFISSDYMEHPYRTRLTDEENPYTEQVVLLPGQGIWYTFPLSEENEDITRRMNVSASREYTRAEFGFAEDWFIFFCPQSVFKIHPSFDRVLGELLQNNPNARLVVTAGRRQRWTDRFVGRLEKALGPHVDRCHMIGRVSSEKFLGLLKIADLLLHPFPFDGSRTAADGIAMGVPFITLPSEYLRGRMGAALLRTMNLPELVARNMSEYVSIATRLCSDPCYMEYIRGLIRARSWMVWDDMEHPYEWSKFLAVAGGFAPPTWEEFILTTGRDVVTETRLRSLRLENQISFDSRRGKETWLLDSSGRPSLPSEMNSTELLPIFRNWRFDSDEASEKSAILNTEPTVEKSPKSRWTVSGGNKPNPETVQTVRINTKREVVLSRIQSTALSGDFNQAYELGVSAVAEYPRDPLLLLEVGIIQYFRAEYSSAISFCETAAAELLAKGEESSEVFGCIGVAAVYALDEDRAISSLYSALRTTEHVSAIKSAIFEFPKKSIENSLMTALHRFGRYVECIETATGIMNIPSVTEGGAYLILFSVVKWSEKSISPLNDLYKAIRGKDVLPMMGKSFVDVIRHIQLSYGHIIETTRECLVELPKDSDETTAVSTAANDFARLLRPEPMVPSVSSELYGYSLSDDQVGNRIAIITQCYFESVTSKSISGDILNALSKNLVNPLISDIYLLNEKTLSFENLPNSHKIHQIVTGKRLTFQDAFIFANEYLAGRTVILANSDIYFDESLVRLGRVSELQLRDIVIALQKWTDWSPLKPFIHMNPRIDSQDAWIFQAPVQDAVIQDSAFYLGAPRCDNRIAAIFSQHGYTVRNPAIHIHAIELMSKGRASGIYDMKDSVLGNTMDVLIDNYFNLDHES